MNFVYLLFLVASIAKVSAYTEVRLQGGSSSYEGRVEVLHDGEWGTICDDGWGLNEATVVCQQLDYALATYADRSLEFGKGTGTIWMDDVVCDGTESSLEDCRRTDWGEHDCSHKEDAGVICSAVKEGAVRLLGSSSRFEGRVEVYYQDRWGTICDHGWTNNDADVVCRQLGYGKAKTAIGNAYRYYGYATSPYVLEDMRCDGFEDNILDCVPYDDTPEGCDVYDVAGAVCYGSNSDGLSPEAIAGIVLAVLFGLGIVLCVVAGVFAAKNKRKRATTAQVPGQAHPSVSQPVATYSVSGGTSFPQGPYPSTGPMAYYNPSAAMPMPGGMPGGAPPAYTVHSPMGPPAAGAQGQQSQDEHIYKEAL